MKIAFFLFSFPLKESDDPVFPASWEYTRELIKQGHELLVVTFCDPHNPEDKTGIYDVGGIKVARKLRDWSAYNTFDRTKELTNTSTILGSARELYVTYRDELRAFAPDVVECQEFYGMGLFVAADHEFPIVVRCYGPLGTLMQANLIGEFAKSDIELVNAIEQAVICQADGLISICDDIAATLSSLSGRELSDFEIIRTPFTVGETVKSEIRPIDSPNFPTIFFWGQLTALKGIDTLIETLPELKRHFPNFKILVGGKEGKSEGESETLASRLKREIAESEFKEQVQFLGFMERQDIVKNAVSADICVFPSRYETACYSALEAMSYGAPIIASRIGGLQEYCVDLETGLLFESGNSADLSEKLVALSKNEELRRNFSKAARKRIQTICSPKLNVEMSLKVYQQAISRFDKKDDFSGQPFQFLVNSVGRCLDTVHIDDLPKALKAQQVPPEVESPLGQPNHRPSLIKRAIRKAARLIGLN